MGLPMTDAEKLQSFDKMARQLGVLTRERDARRSRNRGYAETFRNKLREEGCGGTTIWAPKSVIPIIRILSVKLRDAVGVEALQDLSKEEIEGMVESMVELMLGGEPEDPLAMLDAPVFKDEPVVQEAAKPVKAAEVAPPAEKPRAVRVGPAVFMGRKVPDICGATGRGWPESVVTHKMHPAEVVKVSPGGHISYESKRIVTPKGREMTFTDLPGDAYGKIIRVMSGPDQGNKTNTAMMALIDAMAETDAFFDKQERGQG
jgi:hypothetical protein